MTENNLKFRMCSIKGRIFGKTDDLKSPCKLYEDYKDFIFHDEKLVLEAPTNKNIQDFLEILAVCHTVVTEHDENGEI